MEFIRNLYCAGDQKHICPCEAMKEIKGFTVLLVKDTRPNLSEEEAQGLRNSIIREASIEFEKHSKVKVEKKKYRFQNSLSTSFKSETTSTRECNSSLIKRESLKESGFPSLSKNRCTTPKGGAENELQTSVEITNSGKTIDSVILSNFPVIDKKLLVKRKIELLSGRLCFVNLMDSDYDTIVDNLNDSNS